MAAAAPASLARGAAITTVATALSRVTGFVRVMVVAGAMGTTFLANTYQTANTVPNVVFELLAAGVLTSIFVPTFVEYLARGRQEDGWEAANALATVALVALVGLSVLLALAAPLVMKLLTLGVERPDLRAREVELGTSFLRLFSPQVALYGAGMIMTAALHAHRRFALAALAPIFNNIVVIAVYLTYAVMRGDRVPNIAGTTPGETWVLGAGTTLGVVAMTVCLLPQLARLGWKFRWRFDLQHPAVRKGARLGAWALGYVGGYQVGLIVVLVLANRVEGGVAAYQWAYTFFYLPHALFAVPIFNVLFTAMSEHAARDEDHDFLERMRDGLGMLAFILVPVAATLLALAEPLTSVTLDYGVMTGAGSRLVARVLTAFAIGLPAYSAFLVFTRAFYARGDTKTPALVNAITVALASILGVALFLTSSQRWSVAGLALGHSLAFGVGTVILGRAFARRAGAVGGTKLNAAVLRALISGGLALAAMLTAETLLADQGRRAEVIELVVVGVGGLGVYAAVNAWMRSPELHRVVQIARGWR